jgi:hypothetical protein
MTALEIAYLAIVTLNTLLMLYFWRQATKWRERHAALSSAMGVASGAIENAAELLRAARGELTPRNDWPEEIRDKD